MLEFMLLPQNIAFSVALAVMVLIAVMEGVGLLLGAGLSQLFEGIAPDVDIDGPDFEGPGILGQALAWLRIGEVPFLVILVLFLVGFGLYGLVIQGFVQAVSGTLLPGWIAALPAIAVTLPFIRATAGSLARVMPRDETSAVARDSFVGRAATITLGEARPGSPAQAKLQDENGQTHYVMVEPDRDGVVYAQGEVVRLVRLDGARFLVTSDSPQLPANAGS